MDMRKTSTYICLAGVVLLLSLALSSVMAHRGHKHKPKPHRLYAKWYKGKRAFPKKLSKWRLFVGKMSKLKPAPRWFPYDINVPLFSDYATKHRMIWMPRGKAAQYDDKYVFKFPIGTIIAKTFAFPHKRNGRSYSGVVETRLLVHTRFKGKKPRWWTLPYVWNKARTEAYLTPAGGARRIPAYESPTKQAFTYIIPNVNECTTCHHKYKVVTPIGPKARNLNKSFHYGKAAENQLTHMAKLGYLKGLPPLSKVPKTPSWDGYKPGSFRPKLARAYLDTNCAHCHQAGGFAGSSALVLNYWNDDPDTLGICKEPVAAGKASGGRTYDIVPGYPNKSIMFYRLAATDAAIRMPELGRTIVDLRGLQLISNWIKGINRDGKPGKPKGCGSPSAHAKRKVRRDARKRARREARRKARRRAMLRALLWRGKGLLRLIGSRNDRLPKLLKRVKKKQPKKKKK